MLDGTTHYSNYCEPLTNLPELAVRIERLKLLLICDRVSVAQSDLNRGDDQMTVWQIS